MLAVVASSWASAGALADTRTIDDWTAEILTDCQIENGQFLLRRDMAGVLHAELSQTLDATQLQCAYLHLQYRGASVPEIPAPAQSSD